VERAARTHFRPPPIKRREIRRQRSDWLKPTAYAGVGLLAVGLFAFSIAVALRAYHDGVALTGKNSDSAPVTVLVAGETLAIPANMIRFPSARRDGAVDGVELLLQWPGLEGYSDQHADAFRDGSTLAPLVYATIVPRDNPLDMDERLATLYREFFVGEPIKGPSGLIGRQMKDDSGYRGEEIYYAQRGPTKFVARCIAKATAEVPATCIRDVNIGTGLTMLYRFDRFYLGDWQAMDKALRALAAGFRPAR
jgi:hypothetical protein